MILPILRQGILYRKQLGLFSYSQVICRKYSNENPNNNLNKSPSVGEGYVTVYKFPQIRHIAAFSRLKLYHAAITLITVPVSYILASQGLVDADMPIAAAQLGLSIGLFLFGSGIMTNRYVGFIYFNQEKNTVKVAYVNYWGNRKERELPIGDVIPLSEIPVNYIGHYIYKPFSQYSGGKKLKISLNHGVVVDQELYDKIFLEIK